jgi:hypothetical protein
MDMRVPLADPKPMATLIEHCGDIPGAAMVHASYANGKCRVGIPQVAETIDTWVEGHELRVATGHGAGPVAASEIATELARGAWTFAFWGRFSLLANSTPRPPTADISQEVVVYVLRALAMVNEVGLAARVDGDTVRFVAALRTAWSNPDDVVAKIAQISPAELLAGHAVAAAKKIADGAPDSPFAMDYRAGTSGLVSAFLPASMVGITAAYAFADYTKKARRRHGASHLVEAKDRVCACKDLACGQKVLEDMAKAMEGKDATEKPTEADMKIASELAKCMEELARRAQQVP